MYIPILKMIANSLIKPFKYAKFYKFVRQIKIGLKKARKITNNLTHQPKTPQKKGSFIKEFL